MKILTSLTLCLMLMITSTAAFAEEMTEADSPAGKKKIVILATGGTIAGTGEGSFSESWIESIKELQS